MRARSIAGAVCAEAAERAERLSSGVYAPCRRFDEPRIATNRSPGRTSFATKLWGLCRDMPQSSRAFDSMENLCQRAFCHSIGMI